MTAPPLALYVHWPFCKAKCPYCDFNSHVRADIDQARWRTALLQELETGLSGFEGHVLTSIFFGGGTPSLMAPETVKALIERARTLVPAHPDIEMTLEANPTSVEAGKFHAYRDAGINRVSLGIQSLEEDALKFLGREHSASEARRAITLARDIFPRMSFDLIYARHGQTKEAWARELTEAIRLAADHLSLYQLTLEPGTHFHTRSQLGEQLGAEEETAAVLYQITQEILDPLGMPAYEISNHARAGGESQHNLAYWRYWDYVGIGPGAHGRITRNGGKFATFRHRLPERWLDAVEKTWAGLKSQDLIDPAQQFNEALLMGLRLTQGVCNSSLISTTGYGLQKLNRDKLHMLIEEGYLTLTQDRLKTTSAGRLRLNAVLEYLLT